MTFRAGACLMVGGLLGLGVTGAEIVFALLLQFMFMKLGVGDGESVILPGGIDLTALGIYGFLGLFVLLSVLKFVLEILSSQFATYAKADVRQRLDVSAYHSMLLGKDYLSSSQIGFRLETVHPGAISCVWNLAQSFPVALQLMGLVGFLIYTSLELSVAGLGLLGVVGIANIFLNRWIRHVGAKTPEIREREFQSVSRVTRNLILTKVFRVEKEEFENLKGLTYLTTNFNQLLMGLSKLSHLFPTFMGSVIIVALFGLYKYWQPIPAAVFVSFLYLFLRMVQTLSSLMTNLNGVAASRRHLEIARDYDLLGSKELRAIRFLGRAPKPLEAASFIKPMPSAAGRPKPPGILADGLVFRYPNGREVLKGVDFEITPGQQVGLVGESGSGKSTLLHILLGLLVPSSGKASVSGEMPASYISRQDVTVGYVGPEPLLMSGTIRQNFLYGSNAAYSDDEMIRLLERLGLDELASEEGLNRSINKRGDGLSAGQKQRLCLARALLNDPQLLILDEASANLDRETEGLIRTVVREWKGRSTVLVVSHRPEFLLDADMILKIADGGLTIVDAPLPT